jgi:hypothetical protein
MKFLLDPRPEGLFGKRNMATISQVTVNSAKLALQRVLHEEAKWIRTEIQDEGEFLLVLIETDFVSASDATQHVLDQAGAVLTSFIPPRKGEHAWMVNITHRDALLDSNVGGLIQD